MRIMHDGAAHAITCAPCFNTRKKKISSTPPGAPGRTRTLARMHLCVQVCECVCITAHAYARMCTSMRVCIRACTLMRMCACLCAHESARARAGVCAAARVLCLVGTKGMHGLPQCNTPLGANSLNSNQKHVHEAPTIGGQRIQRYLYTMYQATPGIGFSPGLQKKREAMKCQHCTMHTCFQCTRTSHFMGSSSWMTSWASPMISARVSARTKLHACVFHDRREHTISVHAFPIPALHELQHEYVRSSKGKLNRNGIQLVFPHECRRGRSTFPHVSPANTTPLKNMRVYIEDAIKRH